MNRYISGFYRSVGVIMSGCFFRLINDRDTTHIVISEFGLSDFGRYLGILDPGNRMSLDRQVSEDCSYPHILSDSPTAVNDL